MEQQKQWECRVCQALAPNRTSSWNNERVLVVYQHSDGSEHRYTAMSCDGERVASEDRQRQRKEGADMVIERCSFTKWEDQR